MIAQLATGIRDALSRDLLTTIGNANRRKRKPPARTLQRKANSSVIEPVEPTPILAIELTQPGLKSTVFTRVVDRASSGKAHTSIKDAIVAANPGDRILIRPGVYEERLVIDKPLEIIGDGAVGEVMIQAAQGDFLPGVTTHLRIFRPALDPSSF